MPPDSWEKSADSGKQVAKVKEHGLLTKAAPGQIVNIALKPY